MKVGIIGAGNIAHSAANTLQNTPGLEAYAIASRTLEKATAFAGEYAIPKAYGSYGELMEDPAVELVYVATPHSEHYRVMKECILKGKPVICEKAFTVNAAQAEEIAALAREHKVFVTEAIWTRYMPSRAMIDKVLQSGVIGKPVSLSANLCYKIDGNQRLVDPSLAGGALLDVGVYGINFACMHFGDDIERMESAVQMTETGVDGMENITLFYRDGRVAYIHSGMHARSDRKGIFHGEKGYIVVENINNPQSISVYDDWDRLIERIEVPKQVTGYEYQFLECQRLLAEGKIESESMPLEESIKVMRIMDGLRAQWGLRYPME